MGDKWILKRKSEINGGEMGNGRLMGSSGDGVNAW